MNMEQGPQKTNEQELFEDNVRKLINQFTGKESELIELMEDKENIAEGNHPEEEREHALYEVKTFKEALRRIREANIE